MPYLDSNGLNTLWAKIKSVFATKDEVNHNGTWATAYGLSANKTLSTSVAKLEFANITGSSSHGFTLSSGGLKCPYSGNIIITAHAAMGTGYTANDQIHIRVYKNSAQTGPDVIDRKTSTGYGSLQITTFINVSAGDVIYVYVYNGTSSRGTITSTNYTRLSIAYL